MIEKTDCLLKTYPFNLAKELLENPEELYIPGLEAAIETLSERERDVLRMRFRDGKTLVDTGKAFSVTRERIRQIEAKSLRKLRHPARKRMFTAVSEDEYIKLKAENQRLENECDLLQEAFTVNTGLSADHAAIDSMVKIANILETPISKLDLSVRSYNCLARAGKKTLKDLRDMTMDEFYRIRNIGRKSAEEVVKMLHGYGITLHASGMADHNGVAHD